MWSGFVSALFSNFDKNENLTTCQTCRMLNVHILFCVIRVRNVVVPISFKGDTIHCHLSIINKIKAQVESNKGGHA